MQHRQIILDTETTGLSTEDGHRIIEIAAVEMLNRKITGRHFHQYLQPERAIDPAAFAIHGISTEFLADKPVFAEILDNFLTFIGDAELIIHNASFDLGFLNYEIKRAGQNKLINDRRSVIDTLQLARKKHPGQHNNLDALCKRYGIDNSERSLHGALLDAHLLAAVYLAMTGGQISLFADTLFEANKETVIKSAQQVTTSRQKPLRVIQATSEELSAHHQRLEAIKSISGLCLWEDTVTEKVS